MNYVAKSLSPSTQVRNECRFLSMRAASVGDVNMLTRLARAMFGGADDSGTELAIALPRQPYERQTTDKGVTMCEKRGRANG